VGGNPMRWLDEADASIARMREHGIDLHALTREEWLALPADERKATGPAGGRVVRDMAYRGAAPFEWLMCSRRDERSDSWILWDLRSGKAEVMFGPIPDRRLAMSLGNLAATSRATRLVLGSVTVLAAAAMAEVEVWRRERTGG
jgi:hypothetical protein